MKSPEFNHPDSTIALVEKLNAHPVLKARVASLLELVENAAGDVVRANDAEMRVISELRQMGSELLHSWANNQSEIAVALTAAKDGVKKRSKRSVLAYYIWSYTNTGMGFV